MKRSPRTTLWAVKDSSCHIMQAANLILFMEFINPHISFLHVKEGNLSAGVSKNTTVVSFYSFIQVNHVVKYPVINSADTEESSVSTEQHELLFKRNGFKVFIKHQTETSTL